MHIYSNKEKCPICKEDTNLIVFGYQHICKKCEKAINSFITQHMAEKATQQVFFNTYYNKIFGKDYSMEVVTKSYAERNK